MFVVGYWIARTMLTDPSSHSDSNHMALLLQGVPGSGKTTIADIIQKNLNGYQWEPRG